MAPALDYHTAVEKALSATLRTDFTERTAAPQDPATYYNARLDPKNYLEGPLSPNPATRLRQMLARPGIVTAPGICDGISARCALEAGFECLYQRLDSSLVLHLP